MPLHSLIERWRRTQDQQHPWRRRIGAALILIGIPGLLLPIIPGILLLTCGVIILRRPDWKRRVVERWDLYHKKKIKKKESAH